MKKKQVADFLKWLEIEAGIIEFVNKSVIADKYLQHLKDQPAPPEITHSNNTSDDLPF